VAVSPARWSAFVDWGARLYKESRFDENEREYKLQIAANVALARRQLLEAQEWFDALKRAFGPPNNLTHWRTHDDFLGWCKQNPAAAADALESVWSSETSVAVALARFDRRVPRTVLEGAGTRLSIASFLLLGVDPRDFPFFRPVAVQHQYELVGFDRSAHDADLGNRYEEWLAFLDRLICALAKRDVAVRDRLDAQGIAWWLAEADPPEDWPAETREAFLAFQDGRLPV
jgi:hypothetical protein